MWLDWRQRFQYVLYIKTKSDCTINFILFLINQVFNSDRIECNLAERITSILYKRWFWLLLSYVTLLQQNKIQPLQQKSSTLKGNVWSQVGGLSPLLMNNLCSLIPLMLRKSKVNRVSAAPGLSWTVFGFVRSLLVQSYHTWIQVEASYKESSCAWS